jgi:hypothetical protein
MRRAHLILSVSGGLQEDAPSLGGPAALMMRETSERPEAIEAGAAQLGRHSGAAPSSPPQAGCSPIRRPTRHAHGPQHLSATAPPHHASRRRISSRH